MSDVLGVCIAMLMLWEVPCCVVPGNMWEPLADRAASMNSLPISETMELINQGVFSDRAGRGFEAQQNQLLSTELQPVVENYWRHSREAEKGNTNQASFTETLGNTWQVRTKERKIWKRGMGPIWLGKDPRSWRRAEGSCLKGKT